MYGTFRRHASSFTHIVLQQVRGIAAARASACGEPRSMAQIVLGGADDDRQTAADRIVVGSACEESPDLGDAVLVVEEKDLDGVEADVAGGEA